MWMIWALLWMLFSPGLAEEMGGAFSLGLILLFTLVVKNAFWLYRYYTLIIKNFQLDYNELEPLTDESEYEDYHHLPNHPPPERTFSSYLSKLETGLLSDSECTICLGKLKAEQPVSSLTQCGHKFHHDCITHWLQMKNSCPLDRKPLIQ